MSLWLSGANTVANRARGHARAAVNRRIGDAAQEATRFWTRAWLAALTPKRRR